MTRGPDVLKIDVEGMEFAVMRSILETPTNLHPAQIALELHSWKQPAQPMHGPRFKHGLRFKTAGELVLFMQTMLFRGSYILTDLRDQAHAHCEYCAELLFVLRCKAAAANTSAV
jgi:hypothetical protein